MKEDFVLIDDGTLDTVLRCLTCGGEERFNWFVLCVCPPAKPCDDPDSGCTVRVYELADEQHECREVDNAVS